MKLKEKWKAAIEKQKKINEFYTIKERRAERNAFLLLAGAGLVASLLTMMLLIIGVPFMYQVWFPLLTVIIPGGYSLYKINKIEIATTRRYEAALNQA